MQSNVNQNTQVSSEDYHDQRKSTRISLPTVHTWAHESGQRWVLVPSGARDFAKFILFVSQQATTNPKRAVWRWIRSNQIFSYLTNNLKTVFCTNENILNFRSNFTQRKKTFNWFFWSLNYISKLMKTNCLHPIGNNSAVGFLMSQKGKLQLEYNGNVFVKEKSRLKKTYWWVWMIRLELLFLT